MGECKPVSTPMETGLKLERAQKEEEMENIPYQALIGSLMYLAIATRPDIMFTVSYLSQYNTCFGKTHWQAAKRVLRYLKGTKNVSIRYKKTGSALVGMADADWAACTIDRRSYTGYMFKYGGGLISYATKKQRVVALSTAEAEYMAMTEAAKEALHLKQLLEDIGVATQAVPIYNDNLAAQKLANNLMTGKRSKHISIREHFIRDCVQKKLITIHYKDTDNMEADLLTKALTQPRGIPVVSKNRKERIEAIAKYLSQASHHIVCLQEVWSEKDYIYLRDKLSETLPYSHYFYSGVLGSGLCVFSKWMIQDVFFHQWPLNGYIHKIHHGDWFGGKGVGLCRIKWNDKLINVYCTHLHAEYHADDIYLAHRVLQAYSTAEFVNLTTSPADVSILAGDLNAAPGDLSFRLITQLPALIDPGSLDHILKKIDKIPGTCDNINNSYSDTKLVKSCPEGKRIDHILFHVNPSLEANVINFGNPLEDRVPGESFSYSDHNAVYLELKLTKSNEKFKQRQMSADERFQETIEEAIKVCKEATKTIAKSKKLFLFTGGLMFMFLLGSVGFWPNNVLSDIFRIIITGISFYYIIMGTLWNRIEMNSIKAGLFALENFNKSRNDIKANY